MVPIVLVLGTSTAGKTTIVSNEAFANFYKTGTDLATHDFDLVLNTTRKIIEHLLKVGKCNNLKEVLSSSGIDKDEAAEIIANSVIYGDKSCHYTTRLSKDLENYPELYYKIADTAIFEHAALKALQNQPVILDMVPSPGYCIGELFKSTLKEYSLEGSIILVHVGVEDLSERIIERNRDITDQRIGMFPFLQYSCIFNTKESSIAEGLDSKHPDVVAFTSPGAIKASIEKLRGEYTIVELSHSQYSDDRVEEFIKKMGFTAEEIGTDKSLKVFPTISKYDALIHNTSDDRAANISIIYHTAVQGVWNQHMEKAKTEYCMWTKHVIALYLDPQSYLDSCFTEAFACYGAEIVSLYMQQSNHIGYDEDSYNLLGDSKFDTELGLD